MNASSNFTQDDLACPGDSVMIRTVKVMVIMILAGFGIFGNVLVILIAVLYTKQKNLHHLIVNMAVSDTLVILLYTLQNVPALLNKYAWWIFPNIATARNLCKVVKILEFASRAVSLLTLVIISIGRYRATRGAALRLRPYTMRQRVATVTCTWGFAVASNISIFFTTEIHLRHGIYVCEFMAYTTIYEIVMITMSITLVSSFSFVILLCILTSLRLRRTPAVQANLPDVQRKKRAKHIANAVRMVVCSILLYGCCYSPSLFWLAYFFEISLNGFSYETFGLGCKGLGLLLFITNFLVLLNSCLSPYFYITFLPDFRQAAKRLLLSKQQPAEQTSLELSTVIENRDNNSQIDL